MKNFFIFLTILLFLENYSFADIEPYCLGNFNQENLKKIDQFKVKEIKISVNKYKKWQKNNIKILIGNTRIIPKKLKQNFKAKINVTFDNNINCSFVGSVRQHGDQKDHIKLKDNNVIQSLDVGLKTGHINGIVKFKLFVLGTRGDSNDEIIITELLREFGYLSPRTMFVNVDINGTKSKMIFQEKAVKEMLEFNSRREGPILEGDERYIWKLVEQFENNHKSNYGIGMLPALEKGVKAQLSRQSNSAWAFKSSQHSKISFKSLTYLNRSYLRYINNLHKINEVLKEKNQPQLVYWKYNLDNNFLALNDREKIKELEIYNIILFASNGWHGMSSHNRKFYWNSLKNYFEPIYYDANVKINKTVEEFSGPFSDGLDKSILTLKNKLKNINIYNFSKKINSKGLDLKETELKTKLDKIYKNVELIGEIISKSDQGIIDNYINLNKASWENYFDFSKSVNQKIKFLTNDLFDNKKSSNINKFKYCDFNLENCETVYLDDDDTKKLIEGRLSIDNSPYQYLGSYKSQNQLILNKQNNLNYIKFENTDIFFNKSIKIEFKNNNKVIDIYQEYPEDRVLFFGGKLNNVKINFYGSKEFEVTELKRYPFDQNGLTGCLTLLDVELNLVSIYSEKSNCEDAINLVNTKGSIDLIESNNSYKDGLDVDFSNLEINKINVHNAGNDCTDFSAGKYKVYNLNLSDCSDKGLSVGEKSFLELKNIFIDNAAIGVSSKDSSIVDLENANITNSKVCFEAKRKKQEFSGGIINILKSHCPNSTLESVQEESYINYL